MRRGKGNDAVLIATRISEFLNEYAPQFLTTSAHTLKAYRDALTLYFQFLQEQGVNPTTLTRVHLKRTWLEQWVVWMKNERGNSPDTCNNRLASMRRFLEYLGDRDVGMQCLFLESKLIKRQKPTKKKVKGMSRNAVAALLAEPDTSTMIGRRDMAFLALLYSTAARLDEIRSLTIGQVHLDAPKPYLNIIGKGGKIRTAYLMPRIASIVGAYMRESLPCDSGDSGFVFPSKINGGKMSEAAWDKRIKKYAKAAHGRCPDVPANAHAHQLRHAKASHWLEDGMNIVEIQHLLGHEQIETTMRYLDISMSEKIKALATLESEKDRQTHRKWKNPDGTLVGFVGLGDQR